MTTVKTIGVVPANSRSTRNDGAIALDQWRGLAIVLVLISHGLFFTHRVDGAGRIGVNLFFFISGVLVFRSLASTKKTGWSMLGSFWWRRLRRLYPALLAYIFVMFALMPWLQHIPTSLDSGDFWSYVHALPAALFYYVDYANNVPASLGHFWSLAVEVQFYFLAPFLFLLGNGGPKRRFWVFGTVLLIAMGYGLIEPFRVKMLDSVRYQFQIAVWPMVLGFFCESSKDRFLATPQWAVKLVYWLGLVTLPLALVIMAAVSGTKLLVIGMGGFLLLPCFFSYLFAMPLFGVTGEGLTWMGRRTYSVYLLQQPFTIAEYLPYYLRPIGTVVATILGAYWFQWFEKPFLSENRERQIEAPLALAGESPRETTQVPMGQAVTRAEARKSGT